MFPNPCEEKDFSLGSMANALITQDLVKKIKTFNPKEYRSEVKKLRPNKKLLAKLTKDNV